MNLSAKHCIFADRFMRFDRIKPPRSSGSAACAALAGGRTTAGCKFCGRGLMKVRLLRHAQCILGQILLEAARGRFEQEELPYFFEN